MSTENILQPDVAFLRGPVSELANYRVLGVIDKVQLVMDKVTETTYVIKVSDRQEPLEGRIIQKTQYLGNLIVTKILGFLYNCNFSIPPISVNSRSEVEQVKLFRVILNRERQKLSLENGTAEKLWGKAVSKKHVLSFS